MPLGSVEGPRQPRRAGDQVALDGVGRLVVVDPLLNPRFEFGRVFLRQDGVEGRLGPQRRV